jgi:LacI family transcriptional regulator
MAAQKGLGLTRVAEAAGVSVATVSNTINRPEIVAEATRERVLAAMRALEFVPNRAAATLRQGTNRLLGLVVPELVNPFYAAITEAIATAAGAEGYALALCVSRDEPAAELRHFEMLAEQRAAGAIVVPYRASAERLRQLRLVGTHLVLIDRVADAHDGCSVVVDDAAGGRLAVEHLLATAPGPGLTLVNGPAGIPQCADRRRGALAALDARDEDAPVEFEGPRMTVDEGVAIGLRIAASAAPRRVFCTNDQLALGVIRGLREAGVDTPADARVVGYGDLALATGGEVGVTTVAQPMAAMGAAAVRAVLDEIRAPATHRHASTVFEPALVVRDSAPA